MTFTERASIETGFSDVFQSDIAPKLNEAEAHRQALLKKAMLHAGIPLAIAALIALYALVTASDMEGRLVGSIVPLAFGGVIAAFLWHRQARQWGNTISEAVMPGVCRFLGDLSHDKTASRRFPLDSAQGLGLIGSFNRTNLEDRLEGTYRDTDFELVEAHLRRRSGGNDDNSKTTTVFKGLLIRIGVPERVPTDIFIARELGGFGNALGEMFAFGTGRSKPRVTFDHAEFEAAFAVYADDPDAARRIMPDPFLDSLLAIAHSEGGDKGTRAMRAGFRESDFFLALERKDSFMEMGGLRQPVHDVEEDLHGLFEDLAIVRRIIDRLHGDTPDG